MGDYVLRGITYRGHSVNDTLPSAVNKGNFRRFDVNTQMVWISDGTQWLNTTGGLQVPKEKLPNDTMYTTGAQTVSGKTLSGVTVTDGTNITLGTTTGTQIGTAATQKIGFFGATPVVKAAANPDTSAATLANLEIEVNELKALLRTYGLLTP